MSRGNAAFMGHEKEPPSARGRRMGGKMPPVHSHSKRPHRKVGGSKRGKK